MMKLDARNPETGKLVSDVKQSVRGKRYSELSKMEFEVLFADDKNLISTVCAHNGIINDADKKPKNWKGGPYVGTKAPPKYKHAPKAVAAK